MDILLGISGGFAVLIGCLCYKEEMEKRKKDSILKLISESDKYDYSEDKMLTNDWYGKEVYDKRTNMRVARIASYYAVRGHDGWYQPVSYLEQLPKLSLIDYDKEVWKDIK